MANFDVSIVLRLIDQLTGPSRAAAASMQRLAGVARGTTASMQGSTRAMERGWAGALGRMGAKAAEFGIRTRHAFSQIARGPMAQMQATGGKLNAMRWQMMSTMFFMTPLIAPFKGLSDTEMALTKIGQISQWDIDPGKFGEKLRTLNKDMRQTADETYQSANSLAEGMNFLVASGIPQDVAQKGIRSIGKVATATHASMEDLSMMAFALKNNMGIQPEHWEQAFGKAHLGGKLGAFELKDMAKWFPELTTDMQFLGQKGMSGVEDLVAFLQIVRQGAGTSDVAANNLANVFQKIFTKETAKNFKKYAKMDFKKEMMGARDRGENPLLHMMKMVLDYSKGEAFQVGDLFVDRQALNAIKILVAKGAELKDMMQKIKTGDGQAQIDNDFATSIQTLEYGAKRAFIALSKLSNTVLFQVIGESKGFFAGITSFIDSLNELASKNPAWTKALVVGLGGLIATALALRMVTFVVLSFKAAILGVGVAIAGLASVAGVLGRMAGPGLGLRLGGLLGAGAAGAVAARMGILRAAFYALGTAARFLTGPIGLVGGALLMMVPDSWWTTAANVLTTGFEMLIIIIGGYIDRAKAKIAELAAVMSGIGGGFMVPPGLAPGSVIDPNPAGGKLGTTIPQVADPALRNQSAPVQENKTINSSVSMPITVNVTQTMASPGAIAGAVSGAGQSVAAEVKKSMTDGGQ